MKVVNVTAKVRVMVGSNPITDFEEIEYLFKPTKKLQKFNFAALKDMAILVFKENTKGKFTLRVDNNEGATYPSDWSTRTVGLREKIENSFDRHYSFDTPLSSMWSLEYQDIQTKEIVLEETT